MLRSHLHLAKACEMPFLPKFLAYILCKILIIAGSQSLKTMEELFLIITYKLCMCVFVILCTYLLSISVGSCARFRHSSGLPSSVSCISCEFASRTAVQRLRLSGDISTTSVFCTLKNIRVLSTFQRDCNRFLKCV